jgi:hypothetical protein
LGLSGWGLSANAQSSTEEETSSATVHRHSIHTQRTPSFTLKENNGVQITEYREVGKPVEVQVRSALGTSYQLSHPIDPVPRLQDRPSSRLPVVPVVRF